MSTTAVAATNAYRKKVALAAAGGTALPRISHMAFGSGDRPYSLDDTALQTQFLKKEAAVSVSGVMVTARAVLLGTEAGLRTLQEVGIFAADGTLVGRRVVAPKQFEPETQIEFELNFQY
jgi:hypothetical protein